MSIGKKITIYRKKQNMSQKELAEKLKYLNQSQISKIEKGNRKITSQDLVAIANALRVSINDLTTTDKKNAS